MNNNKKLLSKKIQLNENLINTICSFYASGKTIKEISIEIGFSYAVIRRVLIENNVNISSRKHGKRYRVNDNFFDMIDTEEKAYWLGFITADGNISKSGYAIRINLSAVDVVHIEKFKTAIKSNHKIVIKEGTGRSKKPAAFFNIYSKHLWNRLIELGVVPNKSLIIKKCQEIPSYLESHYWRGLVDGNGGISHNKRKEHHNDSWKIYFCGTRDLVNEFDIFIKKHFPNNTVFRQRGKIFVIEYGGNKLTQNIVQLLYGNSTIALDRKIKLAKELLTIKFFEHSMQGINPKNKVSSPYVGVTLAKKRFKSSFNKITLGYFDTEVEAAREYDLAALKYFGKNVRLNFPNWPSLESPYNENN